MSLPISLPIGCFSANVTSRIPPARLFNAFVQSNDLIPRVVPNVVQRVENIEGSGEKGTIRKITYADGSPFRHAKQLVVDVDRTDYKYKYSYSVIEGDPLGINLKKISADFKIAANPSGGSIVTLFGTCEAKDDFTIKNAELQAAQASAVRLLSAVDQYLIDNPQAYI